MWRKRFFGDVAEQRGAPTAAADAFRSLCAFRWFRKAFSPGQREAFILSNHHEAVTGEPVAIGQAKFVVASCCCQRCKCLGTLCCDGVRTWTILQSTQGHESRSFGVGDSFPRALSFSTAYSRQAEFLAQATQIIVAACPGVAAPSAANLPDVRRDKYTVSPMNFELPRNC